VLSSRDKRDMGLGRVDRQLTQLTRSEALGQWWASHSACTAVSTDSDRGWEPIDSCWTTWVHSASPVSGGLRIGHHGVGESGLPDQSWVALGTQAVLDADQRFLRTTAAARPG
jgi:hypothetical protein